jgi:hypothetical protein
MRIGSQLRLAQTRLDHGRYTMTATDAFDEWLDLDDAIGSVADAFSIARPEERHVFAAIRERGLAVRKSLS